MYANQFSYVTVLTTILRGYYAPITKVCRVQQMTNHDLRSLVSVSQLATEKGKLPTADGEQKFGQMYH